MEKAIWKLTFELLKKPMKIFLMRLFIRTVEVLNIIMIITQ